VQDEAAGDTDVAHAGGDDTATQSLDDGVVVIVDELRGTGGGVSA